LPDNGRHSNVDVARISRASQKHSHRSKFGRSHWKLKEVGKVANYNGGWRQEESYDCGEGKR